MVNHFEFHREITRKDSLLKNLTFYAEVNKIKITKKKYFNFFLNKKRKTI